MKRFFLLILLLFCFSESVSAQKRIDEGNLLDIARRSSVTGAVYNGTPFVYIAPTGASGAEPLSGWMDEEKKRLFGTTQITKSELLPNGNVRIESQPVSDTPVLKEIAYKTPFGAEEKDIYVPHITDFIVQVQVLSPDSLLIDEDISFIDTENKIFQRTILLTKSAEKADFQLLKATLDGKPFTPTITSAENEITIASHSFLPAGFHNVSLKYVLKDGITVQPDKGFIHYNITGVRWDMPIARLSAHIEFLNKTTVWEKDMLFGTNYVSVLNAAKTYSDKKGNTAFVLNNPLPAFANAAVFMSFNPSFFQTQTLSEWADKNPEQATVFIALLFVLIYLGCNTLFLRFEKPEKNTRHYIYRFAPLTLHRLQRVFPDKTTLTQLKTFYQTHRQEMPLECRNLRLMGLIPLICSLCRYFRLSVQYWLTAFCLIAGVIYFAQKQNIYLTFFHYALILVLTGVMIILFFHYAGRKKMLKETRCFQNQLLDSNLFYGLKNQASSALYLKNYPYAVALRFQQKWQAHFKNACPDAYNQKGELK